MSLSRREFVDLAGGACAGVLLGACGRSERQPIGATAPEVAAAESRRRAAGARVHDPELTAAPQALDLAGLNVATWAYNGSIPGPEIRVRAGDVLRAKFVNRLSEPTAVHWHGIALRNDTDGAAGVTQEAVEPGGTFLYEFTVPDPGSYWFDPHGGSSQGIRTGCTVKRGDVVGSSEGPAIRPAAARKPLSNSLQAAGRR